MLLTDSLAPVGRRSRTALTRHRIIWGVLVSLSLLITSCAGERPTVTDDLLDDLVATSAEGSVDGVGTGIENSGSGSEGSTVAGDSDATSDSTDTSSEADSALGTAESSSPAATEPAADAAITSDPNVEQLIVVVEETFPHDVDAFTQGLELFEGNLLESVGLYEQSDVRRVDLATGEVLASTPTPDGLFAEGLTRVDDRLIQLTWKAGKAYVWDIETLNLLQELEYDGQGWGLCYNGRELVMTNGSSNLQFRDPTTFELLRTVPVQLSGNALSNLNELECVNSDVYINIWMTDQIIRVNQESGQVNAVIDATDLAQPRAVGSNVLNGIAYDAANDVFYVTGKLWPTLHRVRFVSAPDAG